MMKTIKKLLKEDHGQALVLVALIFSVLLGFGALVIDYGYLSLQKRELQNAADAAALAAVYELSLHESNEISEVIKKNIKKTAYDYARYNSTALNNTPITSADIDLIISDKIIKVDLSHDFDLFFAKAIGLSSSIVSASATAEWGYEKIGTENKTVLLDNKVIPIAVINEENSTINDGQLGFIGYQNPNNSCIRIFNMLNEPSKILNENIELIIEDDFIKLLENGGFFDLDKKNKNKRINDFQYLSSYICNSNNISTGIRARLNKDGSESMIAVVPIVEYVRYNIFNKEPVRRGFNGYLLPGIGSYYDLKVVGYRKISIKGIVAKIEGEKVLGTDNKSWALDRFDNYAATNDYSESIVVEFGQYFPGFKPENFQDTIEGNSIYNKVYRLVK